MNKATWRRIFLTGLALGFLSVPVAQAEEGTRTKTRIETQTAQYDVYAGGFNVVGASLSVALQPKGRYRMALSAETKGLLRVLAPWSGSFETKGWQVAAGADRPEIHRSTATWRGKEEIKEYRYARDGRFLSYKIKDEDASGPPKPVEKIDPALTQNSTDALTAVLAVMRAVADGKPCAGASEIFDGDRRYKMTFRDAGAVTLEKSRYNIYAGPARKCTVEVEPRGGKWHKKPRGWLSVQEQGRRHGMLPTVWFARLTKNGPAIPVRVMIKSDYGAMLAHLSGYTDTAQKR